MHQYIASFGCCSWIDCHISFIDVLNDSILVDDKGGSIAKALFFVKDPVIFYDRSFEIAKQWECDADVLSKSTIGRYAIDANSENLCVGSFELGDISLIRL